MATATRLKDKYQEEIVPALKERFNYKSVMQVPKLEKIIINRGVGEAVADKKLVDIAVEELSTIAGQKAVPTMSKKSISNFKLREEMPIGARVTLRGDRMYQFLDRLITIAIPRYEGKLYKSEGCYLPPLWRMAFKGAHTVVVLLSFYWWHNEFSEIAGDDEEEPTVTPGGDATAAASP